ncbi:MAG: response regulator transcription factor [Bacillota bacterium]
MDRPALVIISRQLLLRRALACLLTSGMRYGEVKEYGSGGEIGISAGRTVRSIYIIDAELPEAEIGELINLVWRSHDKVIIFGSSYNKERLVELISFKADGYFTTDLPEAELPVFLEKVRQGGPVIADNLIPEMVNKLSDTAKGGTEDKKACSLLTPREKEILKLLAAGNTNDQIAKKLVISIYTVKNHVHNILEKLGITNRTQLVSFALTRGLVGGLLLFAAAVYILDAFKPHIC